MGRLKPTKELDQTHLDSGELPLIQDQSLVAALEVPNKDFPKSLGVEPAGVGDPEVEDCPLSCDVLLETEANTLLVRSHLVHISSMTVRTSLINLEGVVKE